MIVFSQENLELTKEVQELKVNIENAVYLRSQIASQYEDIRRRLEDEDRVSWLHICMAYLIM
jgi:hypothetical protein